jgi:diguanylate cyclase (GGDEF)-like protein
VTISAAALSNPLHGLFYGPETTLVLESGRLSVQFDHGPLFHAASAVLYIVLLLGLGAATVASFRASRPIRPMLMMLMFATAVPIAANLGYVVLEATVFGFDPTPFAFSFVLLALTWTIYATRGFDLATMARELLYFNIHDPVLVVNAKGIVTGANPAANALLPTVVPGRPLDVPRSLELLTRVAHSWTDDGTQREVSLGDRSFNMRVLPIPRPLGEQCSHLGVVAILSDVTQLKRKNAQLADALDTTHAQLTEITRLQEVAERLALTDTLTGIGNRRSLMVRMESLGVRPLAMALIDIDHFKQINDSFGHSVGDRVLRDFTATLRGLLPPEVELFRVGGEEFVLLAPDKPTVEVLALLARLNTALIETPPLREHDHKQLTFSAGVVARPGDGTSFDDLYARADARLYQAKRNGRNRVMHVDCITFDGGGEVTESSGITREPAP